MTSVNRKVVEDEELTGNRVLRAKDSDGVVTHYRFKDSVGAGWFELKGKKLAQGKWHTITAAQLKRPGLPRRH